MTPIGQVVNPIKIATPFPENGFLGWGIHTNKGKTKMAKPTEKNCETPIELNNIKEQLSKISDSQIALSVLENLTVLENIYKQQSESLQQSTDDLKRIQEVNQVLMLRATASNTLIPLQDNVANYSDVDPVQTIIDRI